MEWALIADGVAADQVYATLETEKGRDRAFAVLDRIKTSDRLVGERHRAGSAYWSRTTWS